MRRVASNEVGCDYDDRPNWKASAPALGQRNATRFAGPAWAPVDPIGDSRLQRRQQRQRKNFGNQAASWRIATRPAKGGPVHARVANRPENWAYPTIANRRPVQAPGSIAMSSPAIGSSSSAVKFTAALSPIDPHDASHTRSG